MALGNLYVNLIVRHKAFEKGMAKSKRSLRSFTAQIAHTQKRLIGLAAGAIGIYAVIRATKRVVSEYANFEERMAMVSTMLDKQTMHLMPQYTQALKRMSVEFGESTETLAKGLYDILSASVAPTKALDVLTTSIIAARAGMTSTAIAADAITTIMNSYGYAAEQAGHISDILFAIVKRGKTTFAELGPSIGKVAATAAVANISFEELGAAIATMTRAGLQTDITMTGLRGLMVAFMRPTQDAIEMAEKFDFTLSTTTLKAIGLVNVLKKLKGASAEQLAALIPNVRGMAALAAALKQVEKQADDLRLMLAPTGLSLEAFEKMTKTLMFTLRRLGQAFVLLAVRIGEELRPVIMWLSTALLSIDEKTLKNTITFLKWAVATYIATKAIRGIIGLVRILIGLLKALAYVQIFVVAMGPGGMFQLLAGLGMALGAVAALDYAFEKLGEKQKKVQAEISKTNAAMGAIGDASQNVIQDFNTAADSIDNVVASAGRGTTAMKSLQDELLQLSFGERFAKIGMARGAEAEEIGRLWDVVEAHKAIKEIQEKIQETRIAIAVFGMTDIEKQQYEIEQIIARIEKLKTIGKDTGPLYLRKLTEAAKELNAELKSLAELQALEKAQQKQQDLLDQGIRIFEQTRTSLEKYDIKIAELGKLVNAGAITWDTYGRAVRQARKELESLANKAGQFKVIRTAFIDPFMLGGESIGTSRISPNVPGIQNYDERRILTETTEQTRLLRSIESSTARTAGKEGLG